MSLTEFDEEDTYRTWREDGIEIGKIEGRQEKAVESAKIFLEMKVLSTEQIAKGTGLSIQEVEKLAEEINA